MTGISQAVIRPEEPLWRGMDRATLDAAYDNTAAVARSGEHLREWTEASAAFRAARPELLDLRYGPRERNRIDVFRCGRARAPLLVFIHGGYWQRNAKEMFACLAEGPLGLGLDVAIVGYTLAPEVRLSEIVAEICSAIDWLRRGGPALGFGRDALIVSGWSAGGHLAACMATHPGVDAAIAISGIFDLEPIRLGKLNDALRLDPRAVRDLSPAQNLSPSPPVTIVYGARELPELQRQSVEYAELRRRSGLATDMISVPQHDHFSILNELRSEGSVVPRGESLLAGLAVSLRTFLPGSGWATSDRT